MQQTSYPSSLIAPVAATRLKTPNVRKSADRPNSTIVIQLEDSDEDNNDKKATSSSKMNKGRTPRDEEEETEYDQEDLLKFDPFDPTSKTPPKRLKKFKRDPSPPPPPAAKPKPQEPTTSLDPNLRTVLRVLGPQWRTIPRDLYVTRIADENLVGTIFGKDMKGQKPMPVPGGGYTTHGYTSEVYQQFLVEDVLRLERDSNVLVITSDITPGMLSHSIPPPPRAGATREQILKYQNEIEERRYLIRRAICVNSQWRITFNMFPLRESSVRCPFKAICFLVPSQVHSKSGAYSDSMHFSVLVYHLQETAPQSDLPSLVRTYASRPPNEDPRTSPLYSDEYVVPRMYHYDSLREQVNARLARSLAENLAKIGLILDQRGEVDVVQGLPDPSRESANNYFQVQASCASWSVAYTEKVQDAIVKGNYGELSDNVIKSMNEICSTRLMQEAYNKLVLTGNVYYELMTDFVIGDARVKEIARRLDPLVRFDTIGGQDEDRLLLLAHHLEKIYFNNTAKPGERRDAFIFNDEVNLYSDIIRLYLSFDFAVPNDVMFGVGESGLMHLAKRWMLAVQKHLTRSSRERVSGYEHDRVLTDHYHRKVSSGLPRLVVWLQLPEDITNSSEFPALIVFRPLYRSTFDKKPGVLLNTVVVYSVNSVDEKNDVLNRFLTAIRSVLPLGNDQPAPVEDPLMVDTGAFDDIIHLQLKAAMGRYYIIDIMRALMTTDCDVPDTAVRCNELAQLVTDQNPLDKSDRYSAAEQNMPLSLMTSNRRDLEFTKYLSRRFRRQLYGRLFHIIAGQEPLAENTVPVNLDTEPYMSYSKIPVRENSTLTVVNAVKKAYGSDAAPRNEIFRFKSRWEDRTRRIWSSSYFNMTFRGAVEAAIYQLTRSIDPLAVEAFERARGQGGRSLEKISSRLIQACPMTTKTWIKNPNPDSFELACLAMIGEDWVHVRDVIPPAFFSVWSQFLDRERIIDAPNTPTDYLNIPFKPLADFTNMIERQDRRYGMLQFPVIIQGEHTGVYQPSQVAIDIWDIIGIVCTENFWSLTEKMIDERARYGFTDAALQEPFAFDASARILQHDPFIHVVVKNYNLASGAEIQRITQDIRSRIPRDISIRDLTLPDRLKAFKIANFSFADVALLAVMAIQAERERSRQK